MSSTYMRSRIQGDCLQLAARRSHRDSPTETQVAIATDGVRCDRYLLKQDLSSLPIKPGTCAKSRWLRVTRVPFTQSTIDAAA